jgi:hypothetical protein
MLAITGYDSFALLARVENLDVKLAHLKVSNQITLRLLQDTAVIISVNFPVQCFDFDVLSQRHFVFLIAVIHDVTSE